MRFSRCEFATLVIVGKGPEIPKPATSGGEVLSVKKLEGRSWKSPD